MHTNEWITNEIRRFAGYSELNRFETDKTERIWDMPLVGFSTGDDPYYDFFKEDIGDFYLFPAEIFNKTHGTDVPASELSVVSWVLPQTLQTRMDNRMETNYPAKRWMDSRSAGDVFNSALAKHMETVMEQADIQAVAPLRSPLFALKTSEKYGFASTWSERHTAFVCGLGTFGLSDGLITAAGKAMRCGSIIARFHADPTPRPYSSHHAYCLHYSQGDCMQCAVRCPAGAIDENGHDKVKCRQYTDSKVSPHALETYGEDTKACGLCQVGIPCEDHIPGTDPSILV